MNVNSPILVPDASGVDFSESSEEKSRTVSSDSAPPKRTTSSKDITSIKHHIKKGSVHLSPTKEEHDEKPDYFVRVRKENELLDETSPKFAEVRDMCDTIEEIRSTLHTITDKWPMSKGDARVVFRWEQFRSELLYQYFHTFALPIMWYRHGLHFMEIHQVWGTRFGGRYLFIGHFFCVAYFLCNFLYIFGGRDIRTAFLVPICLLNLTYITQKIVVCIKYGYMPKKVMMYVRSRALTLQQFQGYHLLSGWGACNPYTIAKQIFYAQARLAKHTKDMRLFFREKRAFDFENTDNCVCTFHYTTADRLLPYLYYNSTMKSLNNKWIFRVVSLYVLLLSIWPSLSRQRFHTFEKNFTWFFLSIFIGLIIWANIVSAIMWAILMYGDMQARLERSQWLTDAIDPNKKAFSRDVLERTYKCVLFKSSHLSKEALKENRFQTLDMYSPQTMYNWTVLRQFFREVGLVFLRRIQNYLGVLLVYVAISLSIIIAQLAGVRDAVVFEDCVSAVLIAAPLLGPVLYTIFEASSLNSHSEEQRVILSERVAQMLMDEFDADDSVRALRDSDPGRSNMMEFWVADVRQARLMLEHCISVLEQTEYPVRIFGIKMDYSMFQILSIFFALLIYFVGYLAYERMVDYKGFFYFQIPRLTALF